MNEIMSDKGLQCLLKCYNDFCKMINITAVNKTKDPMITNISISQFKWMEDSSRHK